MRLRQLEIADFRIFEGRHCVDLDADVILIHGTNGVGKSSLLAALECAFTSSVQHLQRYSEDYPRCLVNTLAREATVQISWTEPEQSTVCRRLVRIPQKGRPKLEDGPQLTPTLRKFFRERALLTQTQVARLLEIYQQVEEDSREQPLVRFVRELLNLDSVAALESGLHRVAGHRARLEKASPAFRDCKGEHDRLTHRLDELSEELAEHSQRLAAAQDGLKASLREASLRPADDNIPGLREMVKDRKESIAQSRSRLEMRTFTLRSVLRGLDELTTEMRALEKRAVPDMSRIRVELEQSETERRGIDRRIA